MFSLCTSKSKTKIIRGFSQKKSCIFNIFKNLMKIEFWWRQIFEILIIHKPSLWSRDVPQKIWARSVQPFWRLLDTNKQTNRQTKFIDIYRCLVLLYWRIYIWRWILLEIYYIYCLDIYLEINPPGNISYILFRYIFGDKSSRKYIVYCLDIYLEINPPGNIFGWLWFLARI